MEIFYLKFFILIIFCEIYIYIYKIPFNFSYTILEKNNKFCNNFINYELLVKLEKDLMQKYITIFLTF